jgi:hypothetical protein
MFAREREDDDEMQRFVEKKRKQKQKQDAGATAANQTYEASSSRKQIGRSRRDTSELDSDAFVDDTYEHGGHQEETNAPGAMSSDDDEDEDIEAELGIVDPFQNVSLEGEDDDGFDDYGHGEGLVQKRVDVGEFNILDAVKELIEGAAAADKVEVPLDAERPYDGSPFSTEDFNVALCALLRRNCVPVQVDAELLELVQQHFPILRLPRMGNNSQSTRTNGSIVMHACPVGCTAFVGKHKNLAACPDCGANRFTHCTDRGCREQSYEKCWHPFPRRTPMKILQFWPLTFLCYQLLKTRGFLGALHYKTVRPSSSQKYKFLITSMI